MSSKTRRRLLSVLACVLLITGSVAPVLASVPTNNESVENERLRTAIDDGRGYLLNGPLRQGDHWSANVSFGESDVDVRLTVYYALTLERLETDPDRKQRAVQYLLDQRSSDGGWNDTAANYGGLLLLREIDAQRYSEQIADLKAELDRQNASLTNPVGSRGLSGLFRVKLFYALMSDRYSAAELFPREGHRRLPGLVRLTPAFEGEFSPNESAVNPYAVDWLLSASVLGASIEGNASTNRTERVTDLLLARRLTDGTWKGGLDNVFGALALHEVGYESDDPEVERALDFLGEHRLTDDGRIVAYELPVWDTAWAMRALHASGVEAGNNTMERAGQWLVDARTTDLRATPRDLTLMRPPVTFRQHWGNGWGYRPHMYSDWDDTAVAVTALSPASETLVADDVRFLTRVQNDDGSWSAFTTDFSPLTSSERRLVKQNAGTRTYRSLFGEHPAPGVTGHALEALGSQGYTTDNESVRQAVSYLLDNRASNGMWMGVWGEGYTYGTSRVLLGLNATGADMSQTQVQTAVRALAAQQNADGGWGEQSAYRVGTPNTTVPYQSAESTVEQTAWAVQALLAGGVSPDNETVRRGVEFLLDAQREEGSWQSSRVMANLGPPLYESPVVTQSAALRALSMYADATDVPLTPDDDSGSGFSSWLTDEWLLAGVAAVLLTGGIEYGSRRR